MSLREIKRNRVNVEFYIGKCVILVLKGTSINTSCDGWWPSHVVNELARAFKRV